MPHLAPGARFAFSVKMQIGAGLGTVAFTMDGGVLRATQDAADFFTGFGARDIALGANGGSR